jgi:hypothetical protein
VQKKEHGSGAKSDPLPPAVRHEKRVYETRGPWARPARGYHAQRTSAYTRANALAHARSSGVKTRDLESFSPDAFEGLGSDPVPLGRTVAHWPGRIVMAGNET